MPSVREKIRQLVGSSDEKGALELLKTYFSGKGDDRENQVIMLLGPKK